MVCGTLLKIILVFVNVILSLIFLAVAIIGAIMAWGQDILKSIIQQFIQPILTQFASQSGSNIDMNILVEFIHKSSYSIGLGLFILGLVLFFACFIGVIGSCCRVKALLIVYSLFMFALIAAETVFVILYFTNKAILLKELEKQLRVYLVQYVGADDSGIGSVIWNLIQPPLKCCGINDYKDFNDAKDFQRSVTYNGVVVQLVAPITCCKMENYKVSISTCPRTFTDENSNINTGCLEAISVATTTIANPFLYASIGIILFQVLLVACAMALICCVGKKVT